MFPRVLHSLRKVLKNVGFYLASVYRDEYKLQKQSFGGAL